MPIANQKSERVIVYTRILRINPKNPVKTFYDSTLRKATKKQVYVLHDSADRVYGHFVLEWVSVGENGN